MDSCPSTQGRVAVVGPPEVHDVGGLQTGRVLDADQGRVGADQHGHRGRALGGLAGTAQLVPGGVGGDHQDLLGRVPVDQADGELQGRGPGVAGLFELDDPGRRGQAEQRMDIDAGRLGLVDAGLGGEDDGPDPVAAVPGDDRGGGGGGHGDHVLVGGGHAHRGLPDALVVLGHVGAGAGGEGRVGQDVFGRREGEVVDSDREFTGHRQLRSWRGAPGGRGPASARPGWSARPAATARRRAPWRRR